ncbi:hypothetical protein [Nocardioides sp. AE5]|uniref:hypothetical protein n=1 Tax=Nocardioides sp. AE5 TaxID=2962573 RepID=UPI0028815ACD|nr:hypothetical protein [Nocardioides sp. AE5]MDT0202596.1 hypothetical protein [Nocardioides sp. AE5]
MSLPASSIPDLPLTHPGLDVTQPFRTRAALAAGISAKELRGPRFRTVFRGVHVSNSVRATDLQRIRGALLLFEAGTAWASHESAARVLGVPVPDQSDVHISVPHASMRRRRAELKCHVSPGGRVVEHQGMHVSSPHQLFVELACRLGLVDLVIVGDHLVRQRMTTPRKLVQHCRATTQPHARAALRAARLVRSGVDSPMETRLRLLLVLAGLPEPEVNLSLCTRDGDVFRKYDLSYPGIKVVIEYDGRHHIEREQQWHADLLRREDSEGNDWRFVVVIAADIFTTPAQTINRVWRILRDRGLADLPARPSQEWRTHFAGR